MWRAAERLKRFTRNRQNVVILHFGDHDPSGIDMSRDIRDRLGVFGTRLAFHRLALNMDQVQEHDPPPNPAKETDSRFAAYIRDFGGESWELDALEPAILTKLVEEAVLDYRDPAVWAETVKEEQSYKEDLAHIADRWQEVRDFLGGSGQEEE